MLRRQPWAYLDNKEKVLKHLSLLENGDFTKVDMLLAWVRTPQGFYYWESIYHGDEPLTKEDILFIKRSYGLLLEDLNDDEWE